MDDRYLLDTEELADGLADTGLVFTGFTRSRHDALQASNTGHLIFCDLFRIWLDGRTNRWVLTNQGDTNPILSIPIDKATIRNIHKCSFSDFLPVGRIGDRVMLFLGGVTVESISDCDKGLAYWTNQERPLIKLNGSQSQFSHRVLLFSCMNGL